MIEGEQGLSKTVAGYDLRRTVQLKDGVLDVEERTDATGVEIAPIACPTSAMRWPRCRPCRRM
ncbi:hypothetical protein ACFSUK_14295 [Sphingobium scionense]